MYETNYQKASSVADAAAKLAAAEDGKYLAGGQTLIPTMKQRLAAPSDVIDLGGVSEMKGISAAGDGVRIGAGTTHAEVAGSSAVGSVLSNLASHIGDAHVRHLGTLGGSVANNDPSADYPAAVLGLGATIHTDKRDIAAEDFFTGLFETALAESEIITAITFPSAEKAAYAKFPNPASRYAMAGVFVAKMKDGSVRVAVTGAGASGVYRHGGMEAALAGNWSADAVDGTSVDGADMLSDMHGSADYRANLVKVMAKRAVTAAG